jgi:hypothetical protein
VKRLPPSFSGQTFCRGESKKHENNPINICDFTVILLASFCLLSAEEPKGTMNFISVPSEKVLSFYHQLSGLGLITDSHVKLAHNPVTLRSSTPLSKTEMMEPMELIENGLIDQSGIVITRLDDEKASVTYNDALPIAKVKVE